MDFEEKGNAGIEKGLDKELRGTPGRIRLLTDVHRRGIAPQTTDSRQAGHLAHAHDRRAAAVCGGEGNRRGGSKSHNANSGSVVVMKPDTGDILAMASYPTYDPNVPVERGEDPKPRMNHAVQRPVRAGFACSRSSLSRRRSKPPTCAPKRPINCNGGKLTLFSRTIHDSHAGMWRGPDGDACWRNPATSARSRSGCESGQENMYDY